MPLDDRLSKPRLVLRYQGSAREPAKDAVPPQWIKSFDPEFAEGRGKATFTRDARQALSFPDHESALAFCTQSPRCQPTRPDGAPNRPLTAFHLVIEPRPI